MSLQFNSSTFLLLTSISSNTSNTTNTLNADTSDSETLVQSRHSLYDLTFYSRTERFSPDRPQLPLLFTFAKPWCSLTVQSRGLTKGFANLYCSPARRTRAGRRPRWTMTRWGSPCPTSPAGRSTPSPWPRTTLLAGRGPAPPSARPHWAGGPAPCGSPPSPPPTPPPSPSTSTAGLTVAAPSPTMRWNPSAGSFDSTKTNFCFRLNTERRLSRPGVW